MNAAIALITALIIAACGVDIDQRQDIDITVVETADDVDPAAPTEWFRYYPHSGKCVPAPNETRQGGQGWYLVRECPR